MNKYYVNNVAKAAAKQLEWSAPEDPGITLRFINGMDGSWVRDVRYKTVRGLLRNSGRKVTAHFIRRRPIFSGGSGSTSQFFFQAVW